MADYYELKNSPTLALLKQVLELSRKDSESQERWDFIVHLRTRGDTETFDAATLWSDSSDVVERELAADLLGQFGWRNDEGGKTIYPQKDRTTPLLKKLLDDSDARVIAPAVFSLGHCHAFDPILARPSLAVHASNDVRKAVAVGLTGAESKMAIDTLIALSDDEFDDVRNWATFGLGQQSGLDTPEVREALMRRVDDGHTEARCEALVGLARRKDARVIPYIEKALRADWVGELVVEAAGHIASSNLVKALEDLPSWWEEVDMAYLEGAINRCKGVPDEEDDRRWVRDGEIVVPL